MQAAGIRAAFEATGVIRPPGAFAAEQAAAMREAGWRHAWVLPDSWHMDCGFEQATWPLRTVKLFAFAGEVGPRGGGTLVLPGTHRLVDRYRRGLPGPPRSSS